MSGKSKSTKKYGLVFSKVRVTIFLVICAIMAATLPFSKFLENNVISLFVDAEQVTDYTTALDKDFVVHFVDVGQGDCIMLELPDGTKGIIDAGDNKTESETHLVEYAKNYIFENDTSLTFDFLIATHADADHIGGLDVVFENFQVNKVYRPMTFYINEKSTATDDQKALTEAEKLLAKEQGISGEIDEHNQKSTKVLYEFISLANAEPNCEIVFSEDGHIIEDTTTGYKLQFYGPIDQTYSDVNDYSPVIVCSYKGYSIALTGDAETEAETDLVRDYNLPNVDALKLGHHGSRTSTTQAFLEEIDPEMVFICVGEGNKYNHPHQEVLDRVAAYGIDKVYRTDLFGDILFAIGQDAEGNYGMFTANTNEMIIVSVFHWWEVVVGVILIAFFLCFSTTKALEKEAKKQIKKRL
ncbi:MAG: MBL fold metallo-hydrolase [Clostridia bacterium]|nr:MBL fold metallo-hydrolase [Clostridia bacterium]